MLRGQLEIALLIYVDVFICVSIQSLSELIYYQPGDYTTGYVILDESGVSKDKSQKGTTQHTISIIEAVDFINKNERILHNITLGVVVFNNISTMNKDLEFLQEELCDTTVNLISFVTSTSNCISKSVQESLTAYSIPIIVENGRTCIEEFVSSVFYVGDNWRSLIKVILQLLKELLWDWIAIVAPEDSNNRLLVSHMISEASRFNICSAFEVFMSNQSSEDGRSLVKALAKFPDVKVIVSFLDIHHLEEVVRLASGNLSEFVWIVAEDIRDRVPLFLSGSIGIAHDSLKYEPVAQWRKFFGYVCNVCNDFERKGSTRTAYRHTCSESMCYASDIVCNDFNISNEDKGFPSKHLRRAVEAIAHALTTTINDQTDVKLNKLAILENLEEVHFVGSNGREFYFDTNNYSPTNLNVVNYHRETLYQNYTLSRTFVGTYSENTTGSSGLRINVSEIIFETYENYIPVSTCHNKCEQGSYVIKTPDHPECCTVCLECEHPIPLINSSTALIGCVKCQPHHHYDVDLESCEENNIDYLHWTNIGTYIALALSFVGHLTTLGVMVIFIKYRATPIVRASNYQLSMLLLVSLLVDFSLPFIHIGLPSNLKCLLAIAMQGPAVTIALSIFLVKTHRVLTIFESRLPSLNKTWLLGHHLQFLLVFILTLIEVISVTAYLVLEPPHVVYFDDPDGGVTYVQCQYTGVVIISLYAYNWIIATICFILSFRARHLPVNFNESRHMAITMGAYYTVWLILMPPYLLLDGSLKTILQLAVIVIATFTLLLCLFMPKVYVIVFCPERNTLEESRRMTLEHTQRRSISFFESAQRTASAPVRSSSSHPVSTISSNVGFSKEHPDIESSGSNRHLNIGSVDEVHNVDYLISSHVPDNDDGGTENSESTAEFPELLHIIFNCDGVNDSPDPGPVSYHKETILDSKFTHGCGLKHEFENV
ncbi:extracellular calcium-sensing receptor-like [Anneissia japonica]|uniref:extracellular calcium-sensing receptor-like n=1 Tax=Anneissia japonica TaxID=1529436 RepID=UPI0014255BB2|nr:extracellular calcium-sensing receptor-like [Anneissia japonica]